MSLKHEERERVMGIYLFSVDNTLVCSIALCVKKWFFFFLHHIRLWWNCRANVESGHKVISFTIFKFTWSLQFPNLKICCSITGTNIYIIWLQQVLGQWFWNPHYLMRTGCGLSDLLEFLTLSQSVSNYLIQARIFFFQLWNLKKKIVHPQIKWLLVVWQFQHIL